MVRYDRRDAGTPSRCNPQRVEFIIFWHTVRHVGRPYADRRCQGLTAPTCGLSRYACCLVMGPAEVTLACQPHPFSNATTTGSGAGQSPSYSNSTGSDSTTDSTYIDKACIAAFMSMHITRSAKGLYMENSWFWTADHDLDFNFTNITVYSGRGLYREREG